MLFKKKDNKEKDYYDNLGSRYKQGFIGGLVWALTFLAIYGLYQLYLYLFS